MKIAIAAETDPAEPRVAGTPDTVKRLIALGVSFGVGAGLLETLLVAENPPRITKIVFTDGDGRERPYATAGGRARIFLAQAENTFVASDDPGARAVFSVGPDGKASSVTLTISGQVTEARR